jgi:hypothetical protein
VDFADYRRRWQKLTLRQNGRIPDDWGEDHNAEEAQRVVLSAISLLWDGVAFVLSPRHFDNVFPQNLTVVEIWKARKRWMLSHNLFIPFLSLIGHSLDQAVTALRDGRRRDVTEWVRRAAAMRLCCGSLFMYSVQFTPCMQIYCADIRPDMPEGFSGFEIRERAFCSEPAIIEFLRLFRGRAEDPICTEAVDIWAEADRKYNEEHVRCMKTAVPLDAGRSTPESLLQKFNHERSTEQHRCHGIPEKRFQEYDHWFGIERQEITRLDFVLQVSESMERIVADLLLRGHHLELHVLQNLVTGMRAALLVFAAWAGPVAETSPFFPKGYRGE